MLWNTKCHTDILQIIQQDNQQKSMVQISKKKARLQRQYTVCQKTGKRKATVYWCDACETDYYMECFQEYHATFNFQDNKVKTILFFPNLSVPKLISKQSGNDILILYTSMKTASVV